MTKLKVLCLHGYNNTGDIFESQLSSFIAAYSNLIEFHYLDGPFASGLQALEPFKERGFKGVTSAVKKFPTDTDEIRIFGSSEEERYYAWFQGHRRIVEAEINLYKDGQPQTSLDVGLLGTGNALDYIIQYLNKSETNFDGFFGFSQGTVMIQLVYYAIQHFKHKLRADLRLPIFVVNFSSVYYKLQTFDYHGIILGNVDCVTSKDDVVESFHFKSPYDPMYVIQNEDQIFDQPEIIEHFQGHKPPKYVTADQANQFDRFVKR